jgi:hypothetical protein
MGRSSSMGRSGHSGHIGRSGHSGHISRSGHSRHDGRRHYGNLGYVGRPSGYYYGDSWGWGGDWWPYWSQWNYWWPSSYDCVDYATARCMGVPDYQSCFNVEYRNCPYIYY